MSGRHFKTPSNNESPREWDDTPVERPQGQRFGGPASSADETGRLDLGGAFGPDGQRPQGASPDDTFAFISAAGAHVDFSAPAAADGASSTPGNDRFASSGTKEEFYDFGNIGPAEPQKPTRRGGKRGRSARWPLVVGILVVFLVALGAGAFALVGSARGMRDDAKEVLSLMEGMGKDVVSGDSAAIAADASRIAELASNMNREVSGPLWTVASFVPVYGSDISAARELVGVLDTVANDALVPMGDAFAKHPIKGLIQDGGIIDVDGATTLMSAVADVAPVLTDANDRVQSIGDTHIGQVTELVDKAKTAFASLAPVARSADDLSRVLPGMLGADGRPRNYLLAAENNAEIRAMGGFTGAAGVLTVDDGAITLGEFEGAQIVKDPALRSRVSISDEEMTLFQPEAETLNYTSGDSFFIPDFPRGSQIISTLWSANHGDQHIDGVIALDPTFLQYMLEVVGGVTAVDGTEVTASNAAQALLSDVYWNYPTQNDMQDAVFASVADAAFDKLLDNMGDLDLVRFAETLGRGASEGRLLVWMADADEQELMESMGVAGALPTSADDPQTGLYVNNYSYSKLDWYLDIQTQVGERVLNPDGSASYKVKATLTNTMTQEEADALPAYVKAHSPRADAPSQQILRLYLYAPFGGSISDVQNSYGSMSEATHNDLQVFYNEIRMKPGESVEVSYTVNVPAEGANKELRFRVTPTAQDARKAQMEQAGR
ncbi:MAG: DUF4012 domain-containing protein [Collinsella sp.]|nr:DUF4012 domain-containing protein [Collinsella sp.]